MPSSSRRCRPTPRASVGPTAPRQARRSPSIGSTSRNPRTADAAKLNAALAAGKHILFTPGHYELDDTLKVTKANTIILGLGVPSLVPTTGLPAISVADVDGVTIAGLILDAGPVKSASLLEVGPKGGAADHSRPTPRSSTT